MAPLSDRVFNRTSTQCAGVVYSFLFRYLQPDFLPPYSDVMVCAACMCFFPSAGGGRLDVPGGHPAVPDGRMLFFIIIIIIIKLSRGEFFLEGVFTAFSWRNIRN